MAVVALWLLLQQRLYAVDAFSARGPSSSLINRGCCGNSRRTSSATDLLVVCWATPQVELAAALTEYLAKAHEEKLRAVQEVQSQKDEQIMVRLYGLLSCFEVFCVFNGLYQILIFLNFGSRSKRQLQSCRNTRLRVLHRHLLLSSMDRHRHLPRLSCSRKLWNWKPN